MNTIYMVEKLEEENCFDNYSTTIASFTKNNLIKKMKLVVYIEKESARLAYLVIFNKDVVFSGTLESAIDVYNNINMDV